MVSTTANPATELVAGVDEVGRGPLAGDVVAAAVILDPRNPIDGLADSKKLSEKKRQQLFEQIHCQALAVSIGRAGVEEIDQLNILWASMLAMKRAVDGLPVRPALVQVDGNRIPDWDYRAEAVIKGDQKIACISAASIIAKVVRDEEMLELSRRFPQYGFDKHKGYPTRAHCEALRQHGASEVHRRSFRPVAEVCS